MAKDKNLRPFPSKMSYLELSNFLAQIHLSGPDKDLRFGTFIADGIRGKEIHNFPKMFKQEYTCIAL